MKIIPLAVISVLCCTAQVRADIAPNSLRGSRSGSNVHLSWTAGSGPYAVYRAQTPAGVAIPANQIGTTTGVSFDDPLSGVPGPLYFYQVGVASGCVADAGCDDLDPCTTDSCVLATGQCAHSSAPRYTPCDDGDACTTPDICDGTGTCTGLAAASEACNGRDDTCDGQVDEGLGTVTCGVGACQQSVAACVGGLQSNCVPGTPISEVCGDGIDNNCDGLVDDGCSCVAVAPTGSDVAGNGTTGSPFRTIQFAISQAGFGGLPLKVCVAAAAVCPATSIYTGALLMRDGVSVYGGYQATGSPWIRNPACVTTIQTNAASGVLFPSTINSPTVLNGFTISRANTSTTAGVTIDGAHNVTLSNLLITGGPTETNSYGVNLISGAQATIRASAIDGGSGSTESIGIRSIDSLPFIAGNCATTDGSGRCTSLTCSASVLGIRGRNGASGGASYGVLLQNSPGAVVDSSAICVLNGDQSAGVRVIGNGAGVSLTRNVIRAFNGTTDTAGIWMEDCGGAAPRIANNFNLGAGQTGGAATADGIRAIGDCHPVIDGNVMISGGPESGPGGGNLVRCAANGLGVASRCFVSGNAIKGSSVGFPTAVRCMSDACARILNNTILGDRGSDVTGLWIDASGPLVDGNSIAGGCGTASATGIYARDAYARLQNNRISAGDTCAAGTTTPLNIALRVVAQSGGRAMDVHSNVLDGADTLAAAACTSVALAIEVGVAPPATGVGVYRNNIMRAGVCAGRYDVKEISALADPRIFENNDLDPSGAPTALYLNEAAVILGSAAAVNALSDMTVSGVIAADPMFVAYPSNLHLNGFSPCINAGTILGAPVLDMDGAPRDIHPDIGADEF